MMNAMGLAPKKELSGGKTLKSYTLKTINRTGQAFRLAVRGQVHKRQIQFLKRKAAKPGLAMVPA